MTETTARQIQLIAYLVAKPGQEQALQGAITAIVPDVLREHGCITYAAHQQVDKPSTVVMYEVWADQAALNTHAAGPAFRRLAAQFDTLLNEPLRIHFLQRIG